ncbi:diguanylate cyclase, partial [bacterium]|nr:diguanylate cyclase [bacterium]
MENSDLLSLLNQWQEAQTFCLKTLGCGIQVIGPNGEGLMKKGESCPLCQLVLSKGDGLIKCFSSYKDACFQESRGEPFTFFCHLGLINFAFPIMTEKQSVTSLLIVGGVLIKEKEKEILAYTKKMGLDRGKAKKALSSLKMIEENELPAMSSLLKLGLSSLSQRISVHLQLFLKAADMAKKEELLRIDEITGLHSRTYFMRRAEEEISRARRKGYSLSLIVLCLDQFKQTIGLHGLKIKDHILKGVAGILLDLTRKEDVLARGDEDRFFLFLPDLDQEKALLLANRIDGQIRNQIFCQNLGLKIRLTISCGIIQLEDEKDPKELLEKAEKALFSVKAKGGGNILLHSKMKMEEPRRCVITGIGLATPIGIGKDEFWKALCAGTSGVGRITRFDVTDMPVKIA